MGDEATGTDPGAVTEVEGIDRAGVEAWFAENVDGRRAAALLRADLRRPLEPDLRRHRRRRPPLGAAPAAARQAARLGPRHVARAQGRLGARPDRGPGRPDRRLLRGRERQRSAVLRDGVRRGADPALQGRRRDLSRGVRPPGDRRAGGRHAGRDPRGRPRRGRPRRPRPQGGLRRPPAPSLAGAVGEVEDARAAR